MLYHPKRLQDSDFVTHVINQFFFCLENWHISYEKNRQKMASWGTEFPRMGLTSGAGHEKPQSPRSPGHFTTGKAKSLANEFAIEDKSKAAWWFGTFGWWLSIYWECHHPDWRTHIIQGGRYTTNQKATAFPLRSLSSTCFKASATKSAQLRRYLRSCVDRLVSSSTTDVDLKSASICTTCKHC